MKVPCKHCKRLLPFPDMFASAYDKIYRIRRYYNTCLVCKQEINRQWVLDHPEHTKEYHKRYYQANKKKFREYKRQSRLRIKELEKC
jgi:hypothetical protein